MSGETTKRSLCAFVLTFVFQIFSLGSLPKSEARDLTDVLTQGFSIGRELIGLADPQSSPRAVAPAFSAAVAQAVVQEVPLASVAPAFTYRYNPALRLWEPSSRVPGPLFSERALTLGKGQLNFSVGYSYVDFSELNGVDLDDLRSPGLYGGLVSDSDNDRVRLEELPDEIRNLERYQLSPDEDPYRYRYSTFLLRTHIDLQAHIAVPSVRYGITGNWDISLSIPIVNTFLRVKNEKVQELDIDLSKAGFLVAVDRNNGRRRNLDLFADGDNHLIPIDESEGRKRLPHVKAQRSSVARIGAAGSATGVGDIILRTKYHLWHTDSGGAALGLNLQLPSGEVRDFQGTDETHLSTFVYLSQIFGERFEPHLNLAVDFNTDDVDRSSFVYAAGASLLVWSKLGLVVDFLGRSEFAGIPVHVPETGQVKGLVPDVKPDSCTAEKPCTFGLDRIQRFSFFPAKIGRNDIVNFSFGLRYVLGTSGSVFFGGIIPLNDDGFRADFIPSGGVEYTF